MVYDNTSTATDKNRPNAYTLIITNNNYRFNIKPHERGLMSL